MNDRAIHNFMKLLIFAVPPWKTTTNATLTQYRSRMLKSAFFSPMPTGYVRLELILLPPSSFVFRVAIHYQMVSTCRWLAGLVHITKPCVVNGPLGNTVCVSLSPRGTRRNQRTATPLRQSANEVILRRRGKPDDATIMNVFSPSGNRIYSPRLMDPLSEIDAILPLGEFIARYLYRLQGLVTRRSLRSR